MHKALGLIPSAKNLCVCVCVCVCVQILFLEDTSNNKKGVII
jgi:hypothetical protein